MKDNNKFHSFKAVLRALGSVALVKDKMYPVSQLWEGISPYLRKVILLVYGQSSLISGRVRTLNNIVLYLRKMNRSHGSTYTIKWLKCCHVAFQRYLGHNPVASLRDLEPELPLPRVYRGIPSIIPRGDRSRIKRGHHPTIQFYLTVFGVYRILEGGYKPSLSTITDAFKGSQSFLDQLVHDISRDHQLNYFRHLDGFNSWFASLNIMPTTVSFIQSSSPTNTVAWHGLLTDALAINGQQMYYHFTEFAEGLNARLFLNRFNEALELCTRAGGKVFNPTSFVPSLKASWSGGIGQIAFKEEAAGKLRAFALCDVWTQSLLAPLHKELFRLLKMIPNDGTFDQDASVARSIEKAKASNKAFSFDLTAATDRLPIALQEAILNLFLGKGLGTLWRKVLVDRDYYFSQADREKYNIEEKSVRYAVGQPMGALSSWAMLAVTHHFMVQHSSFLATGVRSWNLNYEILGDDLVIFDEDLANSYLQVAASLGVEINLSKSISARSVPVFEFAKRTVVSSQNLSGISWKQLISEASMGSRVANILYFARSGLIRTNFVLSALLSRFGKVRSLVDLSLPLLSLLGALFASKRISLKEMITAMIDPGDDEFDFLESEFRLPVQSLLTATKELLNSRRESLGLPNRNVELFEELEADLTASVLLQALAKAKQLENEYPKMTESFKADQDLLDTFTKCPNGVILLESCHTKDVPALLLEGGKFLGYAYQLMGGDRRKGAPRNFIPDPRFYNPEKGEYLGVDGSYYSTEWFWDKPVEDWKVPFITSFFEGYAVLLSDRSLVSALDGWVEELIQNGDSFDTNDIVEEAELVAYNHAKYCNHPLESAIDHLDRVTTLARRFDLRTEIDREELAPIESIGEVFTWLSKSQEITSRLGYLQERRENVFTNE